MPGQSNKFKMMLVFCLVLTMGCTALCLAIPLWAEEGDLVSTGGAALETAGKKDPFKPFIDTASEVAKQKRPKGAPPLSPLQKQDLSTFNLVGIAGNEEDGWKAIVEDGEKKFYPIAEGTLIGLDQGRVSSIESDRVVVAVKSADQKGKTNYITIKLHKDIEETP